MTGINNGLNFSGNTYGPIDEKPKKTKVEIPDIDNSLSKEESIGIFKDEVTKQLEVPQDKIEILSSKSGLKARDISSGKTLPIEFADKTDSVSLSKYSAKSSSPMIISFGDDLNTKEITLPNYPTGLTREQDIERFKNDISRELKTEQKNIEVFMAGDQIVAKKKGSEDQYIVKFKDPVDQNRFNDYSKETASKRLADFGIKKHEAEIRTGFNTNLRDPKNGSSISTGFTYGTYIGENQRIIVDANVAQNPSQPISMNSLQNFSLTYQNLDVPFLGDYGQVTLKYDNGKFDVGGKSDAIDVMASGFAKRKVAELKDGDPMAIAQVAGVAALAVGGLYVAKDQLKETHELDLPIKAKVYANGAHRVKAIVAPTIEVGGGHLGVSMSKVGAEVEHNIASGKYVKERVIYDFKDKSLEGEVNVHWDNFYGRAYNKTTMGENKEQDRSTLTMGYNQILSEKTSINYSMNQEFNRDFKPTHSYAGVGVSYRPDRHWTLNAGVNITKTPEVKDPGIGLGASLSYRF
ncbi:MAG: hypothetical protein ACK4IX_09485 [Candidatus Sericytochromatia bacterium]